MLTGHDGTGTLKAKVRDADYSHLWCGLFVVP